MRTSLPLLALVVVSLVTFVSVSSATSVPRRPNSDSSIEWSISSQTGAINLHAYIGQRGTLYTFDASTDVNEFIQSTLLRDLAVDSCSLRTGELMSHRALATSTPLSDALSQNPHLELVCMTPHRSVWSFVQFKKSERFPNKEALLQKAERMASGEDAPYPMDASTLMGNDWTGIIGWGLAFAENHWGDLHPYPNYTTSTTQTGRWHLNTGAVLTDFTFGSESDTTIRMGLTADWGAGTMESDYVQKVMMVGNGTAFNPHWTVHIGDIYYVGTSAEVESNCLGVAPDGVEQGVMWPHGSLGSFAVQGNHEMYGRGFGFFDTFLPSLGVNDASGHAQGQDAGYLSLENEYWRVIILDTGYNTYSWDPIHDNPNNTQPAAVVEWLRDVVHIGNESDHRGIIFLTHHQVRSAFSGDSHLATPVQVAEMMPPGRTVIWLWGHEHRVSWYDVFALENTTVPLNIYGRCMGNSGYPSEMAPIPNDAGEKLLKAYDDRLYTYESGFLNDSVSYNGFVRLEFEGPTVTLMYSSLNDDPETGRLSPSLETPLVREQFQVDLTSGDLKQVDWEVLNDEITIVQPGNKKKLE